MLRLSKKKVKTVYALMYIAFAVAIISIICARPFDAYWLILVFIACLGIVFYCDWWLREQFKCPNCSKSLLRVEAGRRNNLIVDPLNQYDKYCSTCGTEIEIKFTD